MEQWIKKRTVFTGPIFSVESGIVQREDGSQERRDVVRHKGSVAIVAMAGDQIIFVSQWRAAVNKEVLEIPAGRIDNGEKPFMAAERELEEETGYRAGKLIPGPVYCSSVGFLDEEVHLFLALDLYQATVDKTKQQAAKKEEEVKEDERVTIVTLTLGEVRRRLEINDFEDSKTIIGLRHLLDYLKKDEPPLNNRSLYDWYASENHKYNTLIWQFPAAIVALNILAYEKLGVSSTALMVMFLINLVLVLCVVKHVWHQKQFTDALKKINEEFKKDPGLYVAKFNHGRLYDWSAGTILVRSLFIFNFAYVAVVLWRNRHVFWVLFLPMTILGSAVLPVW